MPKKETQGYKNENIGFDWLNLANFCNPIGSNLIGSQYRHLPPDFSGTRVPKKIRAFEKSAEVSSGGRIGFFLLLLVIFVIVGYFSISLLVPNGSQWVPMTKPASYDSQGPAQGP